MRKPILNFLLFLSVATLGLVIFWFELTPVERKWIECFIYEYRSIISALATIFLVSILTLVTTVIADRNADRREHNNRSTQAQLKLSEFRQDWINEIRKDLSKLLALDSGLKKLAKKDGNAKLDEAKRLDARIRLRLHFKDRPDADDGFQPKDLDHALNSFVIAIESVVLELPVAKEESLKHLTEAREELMSKANGFLKREWEELKYRLRRADRKPFL